MKKEDIYNDLASFRQHLYNQTMSLKDDLLKKVCCCCLGREFVISDSSRFQFVSHELHPGREWISFDGAIVGEIKMVQREEDNQFKMGFEFLPCTQIN